MHIPNKYNKPNADAIPINMNKTPIPKIEYKKWQKSPNKAIRVMPNAIL